MIAPDFVPDDETVDQFAREGYLVTPPLFTSSTLDAVRQAITAQWEACNARLGVTGDVGPRSRASYSRVRPELPRLHLEDPVLAAFCRHEALGRIAARLIGPDVDLSWNQAYAKAPDGDPRTAIPWHQDAYYAAVDGPTYNCWVAISETTVANGTIARAPMPRDKTLLPHAWDEALLFYRCEVDERLATPVELAPGQAFLFVGQLPHASGINLSCDTRMSYSISFAAPSARLRANGETFGDRVPVMRGGRHVDSTMADFVRSGRPAGHPAEALIAEILARAPRRADDADRSLDAYAAHLLAGDLASAQITLGRFLALLPDSEEALGDLVRARARTDQLVRELASVRGTDPRVERLLAERILELEPGHPLAKGELARLGAPPTRSSLP